MKKEIRTPAYDDELNIEAYKFEGIVKPFPNHFHDYYVIGLIESGNRRLVCNNAEFDLSGGDILLLNPSDSHGCIQTDGGVPDYRALNISKDKMSELAAEITGNSELPRFSENVLRGSGLSERCRRLHDEYIDKISAAEDIHYFGITVCGEKKKVSKLTGNLPLL